MARLDDFLDKDRSLRATTAIAVGIAAGIVTLMALVLFTFFISVLSGLLLVVAGYTALAGRTLRASEGDYAKVARDRTTGNGLLAGAAVIAAAALANLVF